MQAITIILSLIGTFAATGLGPCPNPEKDTCLRGGMAEYTCTGDKCPPCWIAQDAKTWGCYEFAPGTKDTCPFPNMVNIHNPPASCKPDIECPNPNVDICYHGGIDAYPCLDGCCPPCWLKMGKKWGCFNPINDKCEWDGMIDLDHPPSQCKI